jgi:hypothetical protein
LITLTNRAQCTASVANGTTRSSLSVDAQKTGRHGHESCGLNLDAFQHQEKTLQQPTALG